VVRGAFKTKKNNYGEIINALFGKRLGIVLHVIFILKTFGSITLYYVTAAEFVPFILV